MTDAELQSYIDEITKVINGGVVPGTTTPLTSAQQGNLGNNLGEAQGEQRNRRDYVEPDLPLCKVSKFECMKTH